MPLAAKIGSIEAIESFRASLLVYISQARAAVDEISSEVVRTRVWLEEDRRSFWEREARSRARALDEAQQALFSARLSKFSDGISLEQIAVHRARRALEECDAKSRTVKKWTRDFEGTAHPLLKQVEKLHSILSPDLAKASAALAGVINTIAAYTETAPAPAAAASAPPGAPEVAPAAPKT